MGDEGLRGRERTNFGCENLGYRDVFFCVCFVFFVCCNCLFVVFVFVCGFLFVVLLINECVIKFIHF